MPFKNSIKQSAPNKSTLDSFISLGVGFSCRVGANLHVFLPKISFVVRCVWTLAERWLRGWTEAKGFLHKVQQETWYKATRNHDWRQTKVTSVYSRKHTHTHMHTQVQQWQSDAFPLGHQLTAADLLLPGTDDTKDHGQLLHRSWLFDQHSG